MTTAELQLPISMERPTMPSLHIEHSVPDFAMWKQVFDSDPADRKGSGVQSFRVSRAVDDPNLVMIDLEFGTIAEAEGLLSKMRDIWAGPGGAFMRNPQARIVETVETVTSSRRRRSQTHGLVVSTGVRARSSGDAAVTASSSARLRWRRWKAGSVCGDGRPDRLRGGGRPGQTTVGQSTTGACPVG